MPETLETQVEIDTENPANNIFRVPIILYSWMKCLKGTIQSEQASETLAEGSTPEEARDSLKFYPGYIDNYQKLALEERKRIPVFDLRPGKIEQVPFCSRRHRNKKGDYTCGKALHAIPSHPDRDDEGINENGEFGMCVIMGYDAPGFPGCPYHE